MLWSHPAQDVAVSVNSVAISSDGSDVSSRVGGEREQRHPVPLLQQAGKPPLAAPYSAPSYRFRPAQTRPPSSRRTLAPCLYGADGSLLKNVTSSARLRLPEDATLSQASGTGGTNEDPVAFLDSRREHRLQLQPRWLYRQRALSSDGSYASVVSQNGSSKNFRLHSCTLGSATRTVPAPRRRPLRQTPRLLRSAPARSLAPASGRSPPGLARPPCSASGSTTIRLPR